MNAATIGIASGSAVQTEYFEYYMALGFAVWKMIEQLQQAPRLQRSV